MNKCVIRGGYSLGIPGSPDVRRRPSPAQSQALALEVLVLVAVGEEIDSNDPNALFKMDQACPSQTFPNGY